MIAGPTGTRPKGPADATNTDEADTPPTPSEKGAREPCRILISPLQAEAIAKAAAPPTNRLCKAARSVKSAFRRTKQPLNREAHHVERQP